MSFSMFSRVFGKIADGEGGLTEGGLTESFLDDDEVEDGTRTSLLDFFGIRSEPELRSRRLAFSNGDEVEDGTRTSLLGDSEKF